MILSGEIFEKTSNRKKGIFEGMACSDLSWLSFHFLLYLLSLFLPSIFPNMLFLFLPIIQLHNRYKRTNIKNLFFYWNKKMLSVTVYMFYFRFWCSYFWCLIYNFVFCYKYVILFSYFYKLSLYSLEIHVSNFLVTHDEIISISLINFFL